ncbi:MAG: HEAT repeat domain-containing protein [Armatimonadetes bacterium]|nr:HEAT repeat domain-containing protein [Armatimonadota bacterium]
MRTTQSLPLLLALSSLLCNGAGASVPNYSFPDLVAKATVIAEGSIALESGSSSYLIVDRTIKGAGSERVVFGECRLGEDGPPTVFQSGEKVTLFLSALDNSGVAYLIGLQGKWPPANRYDTYARSDLSALARAVVAIDKAFAGASFEEQADSIISMMQSKDELLQLAGLDVTLSQTLAQSLPQDKRERARRQLAAFAIPLLKSPNCDVRGSAIRIMASAPSAVAAYALIPMVTDEDMRCRRLAKESLARVAADCKFNNSDIDDWLRRPISVGFGAPADPDAKQMQAKFEAAWQSKREERVAKDVYHLRAGVKSASPLERASSTEYIRYLGLPE